MEGSTRWSDDRRKWNDDRLDDLARRVDALTPLTADMAALKVEVRGMSDGIKTLHKDMANMSKALEKVAFEEPLARARRLKAQFMTATFAACAGGVLTLLGVYLGNL